MLLANMPVHCNRKKYQIFIRNGDEKIICIPVHCNRKKLSNIYQKRGLENGMYIFMFYTLFIQPGIKHKYDIMNCMFLTTKGVSKNKDASVVEGDETSFSTPSACTLSRKLRSFHQGMKQPKRSSCNGLFIKLYANAFIPF